MNLDPGEIARAAGRGVIGALAMSGVRVFARDLGLVEKTPPEAIAERPARGVLAKVPRDNRRTAVGALHLAVGAAGGIGFGVIPDGVRSQKWTGPAWGVLLLIGYEAVAAPALGTDHARHTDRSEQAVLLVDHLLYGYILAETDRRPD